MMQRLLTNEQLALLEGDRPTLPNKVGAADLCLPVGYLLQEQSPTLELIAPASPNTAGLVSLQVALSMTAFALALTYALLGGRLPGQSLIKVIWATCWRSPLQRSDLMRLSKNEVHTILHMKGINAGSLETKEEGVDLLLAVQESLAAVPSRQEAQRRPRPWYDHSNDSNGPSAPPAPSVTDPSWPPMDEHVR